MTGKKADSNTQLKQLGVLTTIPIILLVGPAAGYFIGGLIDRKANLYPWFTIVFVFLGFIAAGREVFRLLKQVSKDDEELDRK